ncbi:hypothetical protein N0V82_002955 [Gnomoniopsis sp. IMI 355080]|nr:hypothetical protein N0V82_002955 [Gnomoniopsis sp. IMI 355080]
MDIDTKSEASGVISGAQDLPIKRETSDGLEEDTKMADIPDLEAGVPTPASTLTKSESRSSLPPSITQTDGSPQPSKPTGPARSSKKKGTATLVKKTTSRKKGSASRAAKGARGASKSAAAAAALPKGPKPPGSTASSPPPVGSSEAGGSGDEEDESDHGPYCLCRGPDDHRWMIACDMCEDWFHGECVGVDKAIGEALIVRYVCPRCSDAKGVNVTRYKKTCSLEGCFQAARVYDEGKRMGAGNYSVFCSDKHAEDWWEGLVRALPENRRAGAKGEDLTREKFMGLLGAQTVRKSIEGEEPWFVGKKPFAVPSDFWSTIDLTLVLTPEEQSFLSVSAADRYALAEEIVLNKKMQQLLDLANERRKAAIAAGLFDKDTCGFDVRLDTVGVPIEFAQFVKSPQGEAIYKSNSLTAEGTWTEAQIDAMKAEAEENARLWRDETAGMCERRRCKPHVSWYNIFTKNTRHVIKELARQAKEKLDAETRVREAAATRYFRRRHERTAVRRLDVVMT